MQNSRVVATNPLDGAASAVRSRVASLPHVSEATEDGGARSLLERLSGLRDARLTLVLSVALFALVAWPLALTEVPPFQDLPNHLATVTVIENPGMYPEFVFNGFLKTNAALFAWLYAVGKVTGTVAAAKLFALGVLALNAFAIPRFVLTLTGSRARTVIATLFAWPMIHNWFLAMGMLDFALAVPLSLLMLIVLHDQAQRPSWKNVALLVTLGLLTWYAHVFPLLVVHMLVLVDALTQRGLSACVVRARRTLLPLAPIALLVLVSIGQHLSDTVGPMTGFVDYKKLLPPWELAYNMWAEWLWAFSHLELATLVPCVGLGLIGVWRRKAAVPFFSPWAMLALAGLYCFLPYIVTNWFHVNSRIIPYLWFGMLLRVPERLPKPAVAILGASAVSYAVGLGVDYVRLERDRQEFTAGMAAVPDGAQLLPLMFRHKAGPENTRNLLHAWGYYVKERRTAAPLLFAHSRSFPVMYETPPPVRFNHLVLEGFAASMATPTKMCTNMFGGNMVVDDCDSIYRATWAQFYLAALPRYDHLLVWDVTPEGRSVIPSEYAPVFERGRLAIYARRAPAVAAR